MSQIGHKKTINWRRRYDGYTLIEFLVVVGILAVAVGSILAFLTSSLKSSNQANVTIEVKQNGQVILDALERQIRNSTNATQSGAAQLPAPATNGVTLAIGGGRVLFLACFNSTPSANGWIGVASLSSGTNPSLSDYQAITNQDLISGVDIVNYPDCKLTVTEASLGTADPDIVTIKFTVNQGKGAPSRADFLANVKFQTTISLRKY